MTKIIEEIIAPQDRVDDARPPFIQSWAPHYKLWCKVDTRTGRIVDTSENQWPALMLIDDYLELRRKALCPTSQPTT